MAGDGQEILVLLGGGVTARSLRPKSVALQCVASKSSDKVAHSTLAFLLGHLNSRADQSWWVIWIDAYPT